MQDLLNTKISIKKNDQVMIITGKDKKKVGKVLEIFPKTGTLKVEKLNLVTKHVKKSQQNRTGDIIKQEAAIHYSNVLLFCPKCNRGVRHGKKEIEVAVKSAKSGTTQRKKKVRVCKRCQEVLDVMG